MDSHVLPAVLAVGGGFVLAALAFLPFVVVSYRRRGELGFGRTLLAFGFLIYGLAIITYTLLPLPQIDAAWCVQHEALRHPQTGVLQFLSDIRREQRTPGLSGLLHNPAFQQVAFNIALFVPLGAYLRQFFRRSVFTSIVLGFMVSLLVECTQLTGNWFLFPCPYRIFDVDDLLANTLGTAVGVMLAPVLRPLGARTPSASPDTPRPVTAWRRLLGMLLDLVSVYLLGGLLIGTVNLAAVLGFDQDPQVQSWSQPVGIVLGSWLPALVLLILPSLGKHGATIGQRAVRLSRVRPDGQPAGARGLAASLAGGGGYFLCVGLSSLAPVFGLLAFVLVAGSFVLAWPRSHRGLSGVIAGLNVVDSRTHHSPSLPTTLSNTARS